MTSRLFRILAPRTTRVYSYNCRSFRRGANEHERTGGRSLSVCYRAHNNKAWSFKPCDERDRCSTIDQNASPPGKYLPLLWKGKVTPVKPFWEHLCGDWRLQAATKTSSTSSLPGTCRSTRVASPLSTLVFELSFSFFLFPLLLLRYTIHPRQHVQSSCSYRFCRHRGCAGKSTSREYGRRTFVLTLLRMPRLPQLPVQLRLLRRVQAQRLPVVPRGLLHLRQLHHLRKATPHCRTRTIRRSRPTLLRLLQ